MAFCGVILLNYTCERVGLLLDFAHPVLAHAGDQGVNINLGSIQERNDRSG